MFLRRIKAAGAYWIEDQAPQMGAALAYYTLFSLAPLLIVALAIASLAFDERTAHDQVIERVREFMGADSASAVQSMLDNFRKLPSGMGPAIVGIASLLFGALGVFTQLRASLHRIWKLETPPSQGIIRGVVKNYLLAFVMLQLTSIFVLLLLVLSTVLVTLEVWFRDYLPGIGWTWHAGDFAGSTLLVALLFTLTYRFMSDGTIPYQHLWRGALVAAMLFCFGKLLIGWYLGYSQLGSAYGAAGSLVVFLAWMYYSAQIFFFGAELIRVQRELHKQ